MGNGTLHLILFLFGGLIGFAVRDYKVFKNLIHAYMVLGLNKKAASDRAARLMYRGDPTALLHDEKVK